jgi:predicted ester cyclase
MDCKNDAQAGSGDTRSVVTRFIQDVRTGKRRERAFELMADVVVAHQVCSAAADVAMTRGPANYIAHVAEFEACWGAFELSVDELLVDGDKAYVRWTQTGHHVGSFDGEKPSGAPIRQSASAVYQVREGRIVHYWIQVDHFGLQQQLARIAAETALRSDLERA